MAPLSVARVHLVPGRYFSERYRRCKYQVTFWQGLYFGYKGLMIRLPSSHMICVHQIAVHGWEVSSLRLSNSPTEADAKSGDKNSERVKYTDMSCGKYSEKGWLIGRSWSLKKPSN